MPRDLGTSMADARRSSPFDRDVKQSWMEKQGERDSSSLEKPSAEPGEDVDGTSVVRRREEATEKARRRSQWLVKQGKMVLGAIWSEQDLWRIEAKITP